MQIARRQKANERNAIHNIKKRTLFFHQDLNYQKMTLRENFPSEGSEYLGGQSDGWEYRTVFSGMNLSYSYDMVKAFLQEEGYGDIPIPISIEDLVLFRLPTRNRQILLFEDNGYVHFPIKILFPIDGRQKRKLTLYIYNEKKEDALLRFFRKGIYQSDIFRQVINK